MTDWLDDLAKKAKEKYSAQRQQDERFNREQRLKESLSVAYWNALHDAFQEASSRFNKEIGGQVITVSPPKSTALQVTVRFTSAATPREARLAFDPLKHTISLNDPQHQKTIDFYLELVGDKAVVATAGTDKLNHSALVERVLAPMLQ